MILTSLSLGMFLFCCTFFAWTYGFYPLFLRVLSNRYHKPIHKASFYPRISVIIPTYNESAFVEEKLKNTLGLEYPGGLQIIVVDSKSADGTASIARHFEGVEVIEEKERLGKNHAINTGLQVVDSEIVVITDANCFAKNREALSHVAENFADPIVGAVTTIPYAHDPDVHHRDDVYWEREQRLWKLESSLDSVTCGFGEFMAFRRDLIDSIDPQCLADDFHITLTIRSKGFRVIYEPRAQFYEPSPAEFADFLRQTTRRELTGVVTLLRHKHLLFNPKYGWYGMLILPSRKFFPDLMPFVVLAGAVSLAYLSPTLALSTCALLLGLSIFVKTIRYFFFTIIANTAMWFQYLTGDYSANWEKIRRPAA